MKILYILFFTIFSLEVFAGNCTTTTRTNFSSGQVLTSTALNADFNQLVSKVNSLDGGCVADGTVEAAALNATDFAAVTNGIHQGCALTYVDINTVGVGKCILSVNGNFVKTTSQNNVTWGCTDCSAEAANTQYYIYARATSTGTTLNLLISTTAPGIDGYDATGNKVLGKFYNVDFALSDDITRESLFNWVDSVYIPSENPSLFAPIVTFSFNYNCTTGTCTTSSLNSFVASMTRSTDGTYLITFSRFWKRLECTGNFNVSSGGLGYPANNGVLVTEATTGLLTTYAEGGTTLTDTSGRLICVGY